MNIWSDDCLNCLCNFPHTMEAHMQAVEQARVELQAEMQELRLLNRDLFEENEDDTECILDTDDL